ncbi:MAG: inositol 2-dehydrogenase [Acidobacteria bacterium]|nr:MAG: inositol 2-dehydrogenase [Acidobacteriota bacterium]
MPDGINVALIGVEPAGRIHAQNLAYRIPSARLSLVVDADHEAAQRLAALYNVPRASGDYEEALADPNIEAVLVCTPAASQAAICRQAALARKHIFCEKPVSHSLAEIDEMLRTVDKAGVKFQVGFHRRFDANFKRVREAVASGEIGDPSLVHIISRDPAPPPLEYIRTSGGLFLDMSIQDFDMARYLLGAEVEEVFAMAGVRVDPRIGQVGDVDTAMIMLRFTNGVIGSIDNSRRAVYGYDHRIEVFGSAGSIVTLNNYPNQAIVSGFADVRRDLPLNSYMDRYTDSFVTELSAFVDAILRNAPVPVSGEDGRIAVVTALAAGQSHREHRPVRLDEVLVGA